MPFCSACGNEVIDNAEICPKCGSRVSGKMAQVDNQRTKRYPRMPDGRIVTNEKSVGLAVILSILIPGAGTMYMGKIGKGILFLILSYGLLIVVVGLLFWIWAIYDSYVLAKQHNIVWYEYLESTGQA